MSHSVLVQDSKDCLVRNRWTIVKDNIKFPLIHFDRKIGTYTWCTISWCIMYYLAICVSQLGIDWYYDNSWPLTGSLCMTSIYRHGMSKRPSRHQNETQCTYSTTYALQNSFLETPILQNSFLETPTCIWVTALRDPYNKILRACRCFYRIDHEAGYQPTQ